MKYFHYTMLVSDTMEYYIADIVTIIDLAHILYLLYVLLQENICSDWFDKCSHFWLRFLYTLV